MLFKKTRTLKEKVFGTKIEFVDFGERDAVGAIDPVAKANEEDLIDNFGAPEVSIGKEFVGHVKMDGGKVILTAESDPDCTCITYVLSEKKLPVTTGFVVSFALDAKKESDLKDTTGAVTLTAEQVAEAKCLVFEEVIEARLVETIEGLKAKFTAFESEELVEIAIPVPAGPGHVHP